jgi:hypothetical protein
MFVMPDFDRWREDVERWGVTRFLHIRAMTFLKRWVTLCRIHSRVLDPTARVPELPARYTARIATEAELLTAALDPTMGLEDRAIEAALGRGDICGAVFDEDRMVAYTWRSFSIAPTRHSRVLNIEGCTCRTLPFSSRKQPASNVVLRTACRSSNRTTIHRSCKT